MMGLVALMLIQFTGPDGQRIDINKDEVTSVREPRGQGTHFAAGVHCLIVMSSGKFIALHEDCEEVRMKLKSDFPSTGPCTIVCGGVR
jgi:hypothetical protein